MGAITATVSQVATAEAASSSRVLVGAMKLISECGKADGGRSADAAGGPLRSADGDGPFSLVLVDGALDLHDVCVVHNVVHDTDADRAQPGREVRVPSRRTAPSMAEVGV